jgi:hypothetical protein
MNGPSITARGLRIAFPRLLLVLPFVVGQIAAANAEIAHIVCRAPNGTGFRADIDTDTSTVVFHGSELETFVNGREAPADMSESNNGCTEFVEVTDAKYAWGYACKNDMTYTSSIDRYTGAYIREIDGGNWGRADCERVSGQPQM